MPPALRSACHQIVPPLQLFLTAFTHVMSTEARGASAGEAKTSQPLFLRLPLPFLLSFPQGICGCGCGCGCLSFVVILSAAKDPRIGFCTCCCPCFSCCHSERSEEPAAAF